MAIYGNFSLGIFVLLNNWKNKINISYALTTLLTALWVTLVLFFDVSRDSAQALLLYRMATMVSAFIPIPFLYFFSVFPKEDAVPRTYQIIAWFILALFFAGISFSDLLIAGIAGQNSAHLSLVVGPAYILFVIYFLGFLAFAFYRLFERYFAYRGLARQQIVYVLLGFFLGFIFPVVTNLIMPLFGFSNLIDIGPLATIITVIFISYAITKSHLMDASIVISRAVAEIITIILLGTIYLSLVFYYQVYRAGRIDLLFLLVSIIFGVFVGHWYQKIQLFLQTTSDKLFLRGKYDYYKEVSAASTQVGQRL
ncbi:MAG: histidine kinase N-terminal 7TM domain-containing protein, partial [bacterium]